MKLPRNPRSTPAWRGLGVVVLVSGTIILASMGLVSFGNRNRADSRAVQWAVEALRNIPEDTIARVCMPASFHEAVDQFDQAVRGNTIPVDSVRQFYHAYSLWARDGIITANEVGDLGPYFGLSLVVVSAAAPDSAAQQSDSAGRPPGE